MTQTHNYEVAGYHQSTLVTVQHVPPSQNLTGKIAMHVFVPALHLHLAGLHAYITLDTVPRWVAKFPCCFVV